MFPCLPVPWQIRVLSFLPPQSAASQPRDPPSTPHPVPPAHEPAAPRLAPGFPSPDRAGTSGPANGSGDGGGGGGCKGAAGESGPRVKLEAAGKVGGAGAGRLSRSPPAASPRASPTASPWRHGAASGSAGGGIDAVGGAGDVPDDGQVVPSARAGPAAAGDSEASPSTLTLTPPPQPTAAATFAAATAAAAARRGSKEGGGGGGGAQGLAGLELEQDYTESDDDEPLPDSIAENKAWSSDICYDIHDLLYEEDGYEGPWKLSRVLRKGKDSISVTRRPRQIAMDLCQGRHIDLKIRFNVTTGDNVFDDKAAEDQGGHYFLMFNAYAGCMMIEMESIAKEFPKRMDAVQWAKTAKFRRVYPASVAMNQTDSELDNKHCLGKRSLQKFADMEVEGDPATVTHHVGDCIYTGDVRAIIGVVRWFSEKYRGSTHPSLNPAKWPYPQADLAYAGPPFSERASRIKAAAT
jgi:hypothetical protein